MIAIVDSSAWVFLSKLGVIEQALSLFSRVFVPTSVHEEIAVRNDEAYLTLEKLISSGVVEIVSAKGVRLVRALQKRLGKGESEAIAVALDVDADLVILDDHAARVAAVHLGLVVKGTLGIIRRLIELGEYKSDLNLLYAKLLEYGFWIREDLFWEIFHFE